jgi:hypothetical protein
MENMDLTSTTARVFGSLTIEMSEVQSVQFTHGVDDRSRKQHEQAANFFNGEPRTSKQSVFKPKFTTFL